MRPALYMHVPFCLRRCSYCDFYLVPVATGPVSGRGAGNEAPPQSAYLEAVGLEVSRLPTEMAFEVIYFGGGTPTELNLPDLCRLLGIVATRIAPEGIREWTVEANPGTLTREKAEALARAGVNRVSLGAQSFQPRVLEFLGRLHAPRDIETSVRMLRDCGIAALNLDLIFGVPGTTLDDTTRDLDQLLALRPEHVSCYCLEFEPGSDLTLLRDKGFLAELPEETVALQYESICARLEEAGIHQYELSNFARPGRECLYNSICWSGGEYVGCGPGAYSHMAGRREENIPSLFPYAARLRAGRSVVHYRDQLSPEARARELLVMGLRRTGGWDLDLFRQDHGVDPIALGGEALQRHLRDGNLELAEGRLRLTPSARLISDSVFCDLI